MSFLMSTDLLWLQLSGTATATIGWKYYIVFIALTFVHIIHLWFKLPEVRLPLLNFASKLPF
jgi:hypothetical protein